MESIVIRNATIINEEQQFVADLLLKGGRIEKIAPQITVNYQVTELEATGKYVFPGIIDDQVHFREPGLTHKATIQTESRAAVAGGTTTFMEMPNTNPPAFTQELLEEKYQIAAKHSAANYSFYMGTSNDNYEDVMKTDASKVCGVKIFMGSSTGNLLVDDPRVLEKIFANSPMLIATHCEDEARILANLAKYKEVYPNGAPAEIHPVIRDTEACYLSSSFAVKLAKAKDTRLHVLHISTAKEVELFDDPRPLGQKRITAEACVHHLNFHDADYLTLGNLIKCNPAIKTIADRDAIRKALLDNHIDVIATDHAPHTAAEKNQPYFAAPSGLPLVQHSFDLMYQGFLDGWITLAQIARKMSHAPAVCFNIKERGFIREGYHADLFIFDPHTSFTVNASNILYKCQWSPLVGRTFQGKVETTLVNGQIAYSSKSENQWNTIGERVAFETR